MNKVGYLTLIRISMNERGTSIQTVRTKQSLKTMSSLCTSSSKNINKIRTY